MSNLGKPGSPPGFWSPGFRPPLGAAAPAIPLVFPTEMSAWLEAKLRLKVRPNRLPRRDSSYPLLTFTVVDKETPMNLAGPCGLSWIQVQFDVFSPDYYEAELLQAKLFLALAGYRGKMGRAFCQEATPGRALSSFTPNSNDDEEGTYRALRDYRLFYADPPPIR